MKKISFDLKVPKSDKDTAIILRYSCADGRLKYYTGESIHPKQWHGGAPADKGVAAVLRRITGAVQEAGVDCKIKGVPLTRALLSARLNALLERKSSGSGDTVFEPFGWAVAEMRAGRILTVKNNRYSPGTIRGIEHHVTILQAFSPGMRFQDIDTALYNRFVAWCHEKDFSRNYTGTVVKNWKTLIRVTRGKYHDIDIGANRDFKRMSEDTFDVFLTPEEIGRLLEPKMKLTGRQAIARDWFVLGCYLGLRVNDLVRLGPQNLSKGFITVVNEKTDVKVVIPVHPTGAAILKSNKGFPPAITDVELNRIIKEVAKEAKLTDQVIYSLSKGGKRQDFYMEKWQMVSSHTMRRTAITNLLSAGVPDSIVMKLVGISSYATLRKYTKLSAEGAAKIAAGLDYFKKKN